MTRGAQPLDPLLVIDPTTVASFTGTDSHTGVFLDADGVNNSILIRTADTNALYIDKYQNLGINNISPGAQLDVSAADGKCLQLTYNGTSNISTLEVASDGKLSLISSGSEVNVDASSNFNVKSHNGSTAGLFLNNTLVEATADQINYNTVTPGTVSASKTIVVDANRDVTNIRNFTATNLTGTLQTAAQTNITSVGTLDSLNVTNGVSASTLTGTLQTAAQTNITSVGTLLGVDIDGSLTGLTALSINTTTAGRTLVLNNASGNCLQLTYNTTSGTSTNYTDLLVSSGGNLSITASGGNVDITTHDGSTVGLKLSGTLVTATANQLNYLSGTTTGSATGGKALIFDSSRNISNINNLTASQLTGTLQTAAQPNINSVNVLNIANHNGSTIGLKLNGTLVTATATELNYIDMTPGTAAATKALVLDGSSNISGINSLSATDLTGTIQTASQPNIDSVNVLNIANHDGATVGLELGGVLVTATAAQLNAIVSGAGAGTYGVLTVADTITITNANGVDKGLILGSTLVTASADQLNYTAVTPGTASASSALVLDGSSNISGIDSLSASSLTGTLQTAAQPNINSVNVLNIANHDGATVGLELGGTLVTATADQLNYTAVTPGTASASSALVLDASKDISGIDSLSATSLTGTLQTAAQPNINSVNVLNIANHDGATVGLELGGTLVTATAAQLNYTAVTPGTATASSALVLDSSLNITGINSIASTVLAIGSPANSNLPIEVGYTSYQFSGAYAYNNSINAHGTIDSGAGPTANYSLRADGRILVTGEVEITSDRRLKKDIVELTHDLCKSFVMSTVPVRFNWRNGDEIPDYGYIAQDIIKAGFTDLVTIVPHPGIEGSIDDDGFVNPDDGKFVFSPGKIIPMLALNQRNIFEDQASKKIEIANLKERLATLEGLMQDLLFKSQ